jgi:hypothetical protein
VREQAAATAETLLSITGVISPQRIKDQQQFTHKRSVVAAEAEEALML